MSAEPLLYDKAVELLRQPRALLMEQHEPRGRFFYLIPYGRVDNDAAEKIIASADAYIVDDGLFKPQTWRLK